MTDSRDPDGLLTERTCEKTGLRLVRTRAEQVVRIARPSYGPLNPMLREPDPVKVEQWARWDVPAARTIYVARDEQTAYREVLAYVAPSVGVRNTRLSDVFTEDDEADPRSLLQAIAAEWENLWSIEPRKIVSAWRDARRVYRLTLPADGWTVLVEHQDSIDALNRGLAQDLSATGIARLTRSHLSGEDRNLTVAAAWWIRDQVLDDGSLPHGICFPSKHGSNGTCWAIWLRRVDDGADPSTEPTKMVDYQDIKDADHNPALKAASEALGLIML